MKNFYTEINQPTIEKQQRFFSELFMQAVIETPELMDWTRDNWRSVIKRKTDQDFLEFAIDKLELMSQKHQEKLKRQERNNLNKQNKISEKQNVFEDDFGSLI